MTETFPVGSPVMDNKDSRQERLSNRRDSSRVMRLGQVAFSLKNCSPEQENEIRQLLPCVKDEHFVPDLVIDMAHRFTLREITNVVLKEHHDVIWIDAGCLKTQNGKRVLIAGHSSAGKSTLTMAMALGYEWKVITEDLLLIDPKSRTLVPLHTPFSFKPGTVALLEKTLGITVPPLLGGEWLPLKDRVSTGIDDASFDAAIILDVRDDSKKLVRTKITPDAFMRQLLGCSNLLSLANALDDMEQILENTDCYHVSYGTLRARIDDLITLTQP